MLKIRKKSIHTIHLPFFNLRCLSHPRSTIHLTSKWLIPNWIYLSSLQYLLIDTTPKIIFLCYSLCNGYHRMRWCSYYNSYYSDEMKGLKQQLSHSDTSCIDNIFTHFYMLPKHKQNNRYNIEISTRLLSTLIIYINKYVLNVYKI